MNHLALVSCVLVLVQTGAVYGRLFNHCESPHGTVQSVAVASCKDSDSVCIFKKNTNVSLGIDFNPNYSATSVTVKIIGEVAGVPVPFSVDPSEACNNYGLTCPLKTGQTSSFKLELPIKPIYPPIPVQVIIKLLDDANVNLACLKFKAQISD